MATVERKRQVLDAALALGPVFVHCISNKCVGVPKEHLTQDVVILCFDRGHRNRPWPDISKDDCVRALLNFQGSECAVSVPWAAVIALVSQVLDEVTQWPLIETKQEPKAEEPKEEKVEQKKPRPSFLRAVDDCVSSDEGAA